MQLSDIPDDADSIPARPGGPCHSIDADFARSALAGRDLIPYEIAKKAGEIKTLMGSNLVSHPYQSFTADPIEAIQLDIGHKLIELREAMAKRRADGKKPKPMSLMSWGLMVQTWGDGSELFFIQIGFRNAEDPEINWFFR